MSNHPINLGVRFLMELAALAAAAAWGRQKGEGWLRFALAIGIPLLIAVLWGTFRIPNDPGAAPVAVPGWLRLSLELAIFGFAVWALQDAGWVKLAWIFGIVTVLHYILSYDRILRMLALG